MADACGLKWTAKTRRVTLASEVIMKVDETLVQSAISFIKQRFPTGVEGAAAVYLEDGQILISTALEVKNESVALCHETGAFCEAYKLNKKVVATVCVSRDENGFHILSPCGVCQERLWLWGGDVDCGVPLPEDSTKWTSVPLSEISGYYWRRPFMEMP
jgi:cytidine deaminase